LTVYTSDHGKKTLIARGALKQKAKLPGHLEPLVLSDLMIVRGKSFDYIGSAQGRKFYLNIKNDLEKSKYASLILKTVDKYTREDDDFSPGLFYKFIDFLDTLEEDDRIVSNDLLYISFLFKILFFLGFCPDFYKCIVCKREIKYENLIFNISNGGIVCPKCLNRGKVESEEMKNIEISADCLKVIRFLTQSDFYKIKKLKVEDDIFKEVFILLNSFYDYHL
jgi:DNA repair protein RecO (recombination protein O)